MARMLDLAPHRVRYLARSGLIEPARGPRNRFEFDFRDLLVLRAARDLTAAGVPSRRVMRSLRRLRSQLPADRPLSSVTIQASGRRVLARDGDKAWEPERLQWVLRFRQAVDAALRDDGPVDSDVDGEEMSRRREAKLAPGEPDAIGWFELGCDLEPVSIGEAQAAYRRALELDPEHVDAHVNLGRLLHETGNLQEAEEHYRQALEREPTDLTARFNLGVALEDLGRAREAATAYRQVVLADPEHADAHYNLAGVLERTGNKSSALRHLKAYRSLVERHGSPDLGV